MQKFILSIIAAAALLSAEVAFAGEYRYFNVDSATVRQWTATNWSLEITHSDPLDMDGLASQWRGVWSWNAPSEIEADSFRVDPSPYLPSICTSSTALCGLGGYATTSPWTYSGTSGGSLLDDVTPIRSYLYFCDSNGVTAGGNCGNEADIRNSDLVYWTSVLWEYGESSGTPEEDPDGSFISSYNPALASTTASTTVWLDAAGYNSGAYEQLEFLLIGDSPGTQSRLEIFPLASYGYFLVGDTTELPAGQYWGWVKLVDTDGVHSALSYDLKFRVATTSPDTWLGLGVQVFTPTATSAPLLPDCLWYQFDLSKCVYSLFIPSVTDLTGLLGQATSSLFSRFPFGYATRMVTILTTSQATSTLPDVILTVPDGMPGAGASVDLTPWPYFGTSSPIQTATDSDGNTYWDIIEVGWTSLVILIFGLWALGVVLSEAKHH